jgi:hypothetical protein
MVVIQIKSAMNRQTHRFKLVGFRADCINAG